MNRRKTAAALDAALRDMFRALENRGAPEHVMRVVDQLEAAALAEAKPCPAPPPSRAP
jgi:hypothetical protein